MRKNMKLIIIFLGELRQIVKDLFFFPSKIDLSKQIIFCTHILEIKIYLSTC